MNDFVQNNRRTGHAYEEKAAVYLERLGFDILERNFRIRTGEIDIIAREGNTICFIEVKSRSTLRYGRPCESVTPKKQKSIIRTSEYWLMIHRCYQCYRRYDVIELYSGQINLIRNAF